MGKWSGEDWVFRRQKVRKRQRLEEKKAWRLQQIFFFVKGCPDAEDSPDLLSTWTEQQEVKAGDVRGRKDRQRKRKSGCVDACRRKREEQLRWETWIAMGTGLHMNCKMVVNGQMLTVGRLETGRAGKKIEVWWCGRKGQAARLEMQCLWA